VNPPPLPLPPPCSRPRSLFFASSLSLLPSLRPHQNRHRRPSLSAAGSRRYVSMMRWWRQGGRVGVSKFCLSFGDLRFLACVFSSDLRARGRARAHTKTHTHTCKHTCMHACIHTHTHPPTHTHTHTQTHTHTPSELHTKGQRHAQTGHGKGAASSAWRKGVARQDRHIHGHIHTRGPHLGDGEGGSVDGVGREFVGRESCSRGRGRQKKERR